MADKLTLLLATIVGALLTLPFYILAHLWIFGRVHWILVGTGILLAVVLAFSITLLFGDRIVRAWDKWKRKG